MVYLLLKDIMFWLKLISIFINKVTDRKNLLVVPTFIDFISENILYINLSLFYLMHIYQTSI